MGTDENLFRLVPVSGHGAQIRARTQTKVDFQTRALPGNRARTPSLNGGLDAASAILDYPALSEDYQY